jgi:hypothetical protein
MLSAHPDHKSVRRAVAFALVASVAAVSLAACGGDKKDNAGDEPAATPTPTPTPVVLHSPLTGEVVDAHPKHPIVIVKIDNSHASAPQVGLGSADLVTEELVEGGITRLAVFFDQTIPKTVGPVRSMRATDIGVVLPAKAVLVASGGAPQTVARVHKAGITTYTEGAEGYYRDSSRNAPYNLMMRLDQLVPTIKKGDHPETYLPFAEDDSTFPAGRPASGLDAQFSYSSTTHWDFKDGSYTNTNSNAGDGDRFKPDTVLVLRVRVGDAGYRDPAGNPVPETMFTGKGQAMVFHGGKMVKATWSKDDYDSELTLMAKGAELKLPPGKVWMELVPAQTGSVTVRR